MRKEEKPEKEDIFLVRPEVWTDEQRIPFLRAELGEEEEDQWTDGDGNAFLRVGTERKMREQGVYGQWPTGVLGEWPEKKV